MKKIIGRTERIDLKALSLFGLDAKIDTGAYTPSLHCQNIEVNKEKNESYLYRLDEIDGDIIRNDRPLSPVYKAGKIGGVPKLVS